MNTVTLNTVTLNAVTLNAAAGSWSRLMARSAP